MIYHNVFNTLAALLACSTIATTATVKDIFNINTDSTLRFPRDNKYYTSRYEPKSITDSSISRSLKPEDSPEARDVTDTNVGKRCSRCDTGYYYDYRSPYDSRYDRYDTRYDSRPSGRRPSLGRYDSYGRDGYDRYDRDRDRYYDGGDSYSSRRRPNAGSDR